MDARPQSSAVLLVATLVLTTSAFVSSAAPPAGGTGTPAGASALSWGETTFEGRMVRGLSGGPPLNLRPGDEPAVELSVVNEGQEPARPFEVRLTGRVMGMAFFDYATRIDAEIPPGSELRRTVELELDDLDGKIVGLVPTTLSLVDENGAVILEQSFPVEVDGSMLSAYGIFGLAIVGSTLVLLASLLLMIWRRMLPDNRWRRALHFLPIGTGLGLTLTFSLSAFGLLTPSGAWWVTFVVACAAAAFAIGYLLPMPYANSEEPTSLRGA